MMKFVISHVLSLDGCTYTIKVYNGEDSEDEFLGFWECGPCTLFFPPTRAASPEAAIHRAATLIGKHHAKYHQS
jgi:hypothetical protein